MTDFIPTEPGPAAPFGLLNELLSLRAERDTWRNVAESHELATSLRQAEFARMDLEVGRLRAEYDEMGVLLADKHNVISALRADAVRRIEENDRVLVANGRLRAELAEAKEALRLSAQGLHTYVEALNAGNAALAAKDKRFDDAVEAIDLKDKELIQERAVSRDLRKRVAEMREALELVLKYEHEWLVPSSLADVARAALAPSPAGREERHEMTSIGDKEPDADSAGREG